MAEVQVLEVYDITEQETDARAAEMQSPFESGFTEHEASEDHYREYETEQSDPWAESEEFGDFEDEWMTGTGAEESDASAMGQSTVIQLGQETEAFLGDLWQSAKGLWEKSLIGAAIAKGERDEIRLTDLVFYRRHPDRQGRRLDRSEPGFGDLAAEWRSIRDQVVRPALALPTGGFGPAVAEPIARPSDPGLSPRAQMSTAGLRGAWERYRCKTGGPWNESIRLFGRNNGGIPEVSTDAYRAFEQALTTSGYSPSSAWVYNCRAIAGTNPPRWSLHSFGIAIDIDPRQNPFSHGDPFLGRLQKQNVDAVYAIRSTSGERLWSWGGYWNTSKGRDRMHFQLDRPPSDVSVNWSTVPR